MAGPTKAKIIALNLTGSESADDLRRLAEVFEVREAADVYIDAVDMAKMGPERIVLPVSWPAEVYDSEQWPDSGFAYIAERLHAAGWRPGMTAEDAARMLAAAEEARE